MNTNIHFWSYLSQLFLEWETLSIEVVRKSNTFYIQWLFFFNCAVYEIMSRNIVEPGRPQMTIWRMCIACWIPEATNTHSVYVTLFDFLLKQWLHECASILCYMYIACVVSFGWKGCTYDTEMPKWVNAHITNDGGHF